MKLKFKHAKGTATWVAETPTAIYRVERVWNGRYRTRVDGKLIGSSETKQEAQAVAWEWAEDVASGNR